MPPKATRDRLQADILAAGDENLPYIQGIGKGDIQDEFVFSFIHTKVPEGKIEIHVMPQDASSYPRDNSFLVYTDADVPHQIGRILNDATASTTGMCIADLLKTLTRRLLVVLDSTGEVEEGDENNCDLTITNENEDIYSSEASDNIDTYNGFESDDDSDFDLLHQSPNTMPTKISDTSLRRIRQDFRAVRNAGFRVSKLCGIDHVSDYNIITVSLKISKLGLSNDTQMAWDLQGSSHLILLIRYPGDYVTFEDALRTPTEEIHLEFRLRKCSRYRPVIAEAIAAFSPTGTGTYREGPTLNLNNAENSSEGDQLLTFGIGSSLELLLRKDFLTMMKLRKTKNVSWEDAKITQSQIIMGRYDTTPISLSNPKPDPARAANIDQPPVLVDDHLLNEHSVSLPLIAMQFALHYLMRCANYCMICHEQMVVNFEALKPYVCSKPLCLFQYMNLGLGPSIDHEIINQQYVVDLLISFFYASLHQSGSHGPRLREFPRGLDLRVPHVRSQHNAANLKDHTVANFGTLVDPIEIEIEWSHSEARIIDKSLADRTGLGVGEWVVIHTQHNEEAAGRGVDIFHHALIESRLYSTLKIHIVSRHPVPMELAAYEKIQCWNWANTGLTIGRLMPCDQSLDDINSKIEEAFSLKLLIHMLPSVEEMRSYLMDNRCQQLATWKRIPPVAMRLLRWIIASNRSFIIQLNESHTDKQQTLDEMGGRGLGQSQELISGVKGWMQFRFAQGSPEKEALFRDALLEVSDPHRTILAWHGSAIDNWHSIIREGLNYDVVANGRSFGNGVYFSRFFDYSSNYCKRRDGARSSESNIWPRSSLRIGSAISLNELVNLPKKFKNSTQCYVVDKLHWIQCRYLFVLPQNSQIASVYSQTNRHTNMAEFKQDPRYTAVGPSRTNLFIPKTAFASARQQQGQTFASSAMDIVNGDGSDEEDIEDIMFLTEGDSIENHIIGVTHPSTPRKSLTDFHPGGLNFSELPQLALPSYATKPGQQAIQRELLKLQEIQSTIPLHELGWYLDFERIENMFQWIVQLHSFDLCLPLAQDMQKAGIDSIVLEIRFLRRFPLTPPFVRVIQPRFLAFAQGGGGHVTAGGAMCMELLTNTGWSPANNMESVLLQVRLAICSMDPRPARLARQRGSSGQYSIREAITAYMRAAATHGWEVPLELKETAMQ